MTDWVLVTHHDGHRHHRHHLAIWALGQLLTRFGPIRPVVSLRVLLGSWIHVVCTVSVFSEACFFIFC
jgi:hypothetical protein